jgi:hypothetical protein
MTRLGLKSPTLALAVVGLAVLLAACDRGGGSIWDEAKTPQPGATSSQTRTPGTKMPNLQTATPKRDAKSPTPPATPTPGPPVFDLTYREECVECGATFTVDRLEIRQSGFRVRISVENTGQGGELQLILDNSRVYVFDLAEASQFRDAFGYAFDVTTIQDLLNDVSPRSFSLSVTPGTDVPSTLPAGSVWQGWLENTYYEFPKTAVAMLIWLQPINRELPTASGRYEFWWVSADDGHPFIELPGAPEGSGSALQGAGQGSAALRKGADAEVSSTVTCLNVRETPSKSAKIVKCIVDGTTVYIEGGPVDAEGYRWWKLRGLGWVAENWLRPRSD